MTFRLVIAVLALAFATTETAGEQNIIKWRGWSGEIVAQAKAENRFILLDLEAVWCHWCHVMAETTYRDPSVAALIASNYIAVRVDQDANPDLSARYGDWGWPATIIFSPDGAELVKRRGYIPPVGMAALLQAVIDDPTPGPSVTRGEDVIPAETSTLSVAVAAKLKSAFASAYDDRHGGWGSFHKYIDADAMDWALLSAERGDAEGARMARQTLDAATALIDREWGGIYQYSDALDWSSPHYEKIMWYQANGLRQYSNAYGLFNDPAHLAAADDIYRYLTTKLLAPEGAFYPTQDADLDRETPGKSFYALPASARAKFGRQPRVDQNIYARENGWAISALVAYADATGRPEPLHLAKRAANWVILNRRRPDGLFSHGANDRGGPFLGDQIAMGDAALDLYAATGERTWLGLVLEIANGLGDFRDPKGGFLTSMTAEGAAGVLAVPHKSLEEQGQAARFASRAARYLGAAAARASAEHAMRYLASDSAIKEGRAVASTLLADDELSREPTHITIVGHKDDTDAAHLHAAARRYPSMNKRIDWWDKREGPMMNPDVTYPEMDRAAAFACSNRLCSLPAFSANDLNVAVKQMTRGAEAGTARQ